MQKHHLQFIAIPEEHSALSMHSTCTCTAGTNFVAKKQMLLKLKCKAHLVLRNFTEVFSFSVALWFIFYFARGSGQLASLSCDTHRDTGRLAAPLCWRSHLAASSSAVRLGSSISANVNFSSNIPLLLHAPLSAAIWFVLARWRCSLFFPFPSS